MEEAPAIVLGRRPCRLEPCCLAGRPETWCAALRDSLESSATGRRLHRALPRLGATVETWAGAGVVERIDLRRGLATVTLVDGLGTSLVPLAEVVGQTGDA